MERKTMTDERRKYFVIDTLSVIMTYFVADNDEVAVKIAKDFKFGGRFTLAKEVKVREQ